METIFFNSNADAQRVSAHLTEDHKIAGTEIRFTDTVDYAALDLIVQLEETTYIIPGSKCLMKPPQDEWNLHNCSDINSRKIYCACLASYNSGRLYGIWVDCEQEPEDMQADIDFMLEWSPVRHQNCCEDWAIHDTDNWSGIHIEEWDDLERLSEMATAIAEHGDPYVQYLANSTGEEPTVEKFQEIYRGHHQCFTDYVQEWHEETGVMENIPESLRGYIDFRAIARDWECSGEWSYDHVDHVDGGGVYIWQHW